jgi:hypothetical protein
MGMEEAYKRAREQFEREQAEEARKRGLLKQQIEQKQSEFDSRAKDLIRPWRLAVQRSGIPQSLAKLAELERIGSGKDITENYTIESKSLKTVDISSILDNFLSRKTYAKLMIASRTLYQISDEKTKVSFPDGIPESAPDPASLRIINAETHLRWNVFNGTDFEGESTYLPRIISAQYSFTPGIQTAVTIYSNFDNRSGVTVPESQWVGNRLNDVIMQAYLHPG